MEYSYYKKRDGKIYNVPQETINNSINPFDPTTYLPHLELMDYPYIIEEWQRLRAYCLQKSYPDLVFPKYIALMNLTAFKCFTWKDNKNLNQIYASKPKLLYNELKKLKGAKMTTIDFLKIYDNFPHDLFDEDTLYALWCNNLFVDYENVQDITEVECGEQSRWNHVEWRIIKIRGRYFEIARWAGNTEYQEDIYDCQPVEVRLVEKVVKAWEAIK